MNQARLNMLLTYLIYKYKKNLVLNNTERLICHKTKPTSTTSINF